MNLIRALVYFVVGVVGFGSVYVVMDYAVETMDDEITLYPEFAGARNIIMYVWVAYIIIYLVALFIYVTIYDNERRVI